MLLPPLSLSLSLAIYSIPSWLSSATISHPLTHIASGAESAVKMGNFNPQRRLPLDIEFDKICYEFVGTFCVRRMGHVGTAVP